MVEIVFLIPLLTGVMAFFLPRTAGRSPAGIYRGNSPDIIPLSVDPAAASTVRNLFCRHTRRPPVAAGDITAFFPDLDLYRGLSQNS